MKYIVHIITCCAPFCRRV